MFLGRKLFRLNLDLINDINQNKLFLIGTYTVLGFVSTVMTILNILTDKGYLTICTGVFALLCVVNIVLSLCGPRCRSAAKVLFAVEIMCMFTFFLVSGNPEGFSAIWICMLPSLGMFFFDRYKGSLLCVVMFVIMVFLLWTPFGQTFLMYPYTASFKMRFPVLFVAFHVFALFLETQRDNTYKEMRRMQNYYHELSLRDALTKVYNRQGLYSVLEVAPIYNNAGRLGAAMIDIDDFKKVNDTYGHDLGDEVLKAISEIMVSNLHSIVCRWGGEEFVSVFADDSVTVENLNQIRTLIQSKEFTAEGKTFHISVSIGVCSSDDAEVRKIDNLISKADIALYHAKNNGKNQVIEYNNAMMK